MIIDSQKIRASFKINLLCKDLHTLFIQLNLVLRIDTNLIKLEYDRVIR